MLKINFVRWMVGIGLSVLVVACAPVAAQTTQATPTPRSSPTIAPTMTVILPTVAPTTPTAQPTPMLSPTQTINVSTLQIIPSATPRIVQTCGETQGRQSVLHFDSATLARRVAYSLYLPPCYAANPARVYPVLYLLHGVGADNTQWLDLNVVASADALIAQHTSAPFIIVMPDGDYRAGEDYAAFVLRDLVPHIEQTLRVSRDRAGHAIGGLSRGGYWALDIALTHPELFAAVGGHSPVTNAGLVETFALTMGATDRNALRIYLDVGRNDHLAPTVKPFAAVVQAQHAKTIFHLYDGRHNREYWRAHVTEYLAFYAADWQK